MNNNEINNNNNSSLNQNINNYNYTANKPNTPNNFTAPNDYNQGQNMMNNQINTNNIGQSQPPTKKLYNKKIIIILLVLVLIAVVIFFLIKGKENNLDTNTNNESNSSSETTSTFNSIMKDYGYTLEKVNFDEDESGNVIECYDAKNSTGTIIIRYVKLKNASIANLTVSSINADLAIMNSERLFTENSCEHNTDYNNNKYSLICKKDYYVLFAKDNMMYYARVEEMSKKSEVDGILKKLGY